MLRSIATALMLSALLAACGETTDSSDAGGDASTGAASEGSSPVASGPEADAGKTAEQIEEQAANAETATLEETLAAYTQAIADMKAEIAGLEDDIAAQGKKSLGDALDLLGGDTTKADEIATDLGDLNARVTTLKGDLEGLRDTMQIYADELASR